MHRLLSLVLCNAIVITVSFRSLDALASAERNHGYVANVGECVDNPAGFEVPGSDCVTVISSPTATI